MLLKISNICLWIFILNIPIAMAQKEPNYDESKVPALSIPDLFISKNGMLIKDVQSWEKLRRAEILRQFANEVYGDLPQNFDQIGFEEKPVTEHPYSDFSKMKTVAIKVERSGNQNTMNLHLFFPKDFTEPLPVVLLISHRNVLDLLSDTTDSFFPLKAIIGKGMVAAVFDVEDVSPDHKGRFSQGVLEKLYPEQLQRSDGMRGLGAWAWGAMRAMDYFESKSEFDTKKSMLVGHSRGGKAALWAGANDNRWSITVSNESGCGGAALSKRKYGETIERINTTFPFWFTDNFKKYNGNEESLPLDQHMLLSLIAPRGLYVASSKDDQWADPKGEYLSLLFASRVYDEIYQASQELPDTFNTEVNTLHLENIGYHLREGEHDLSIYDWKRFLDFAEKRFSTFKSLY
ncbi:Glycoprotein gp2 [Indibacter alkaliphilus LW1]|uniref:Glycoprotein gp2 n=1 Tax=Indibacter alkaliphilus (strain CCUG 57479 / KCTC 22604 / LW1) TaxID=1189612 RepID=S2D9S3_INDAL|nr:alpha/beta hydrolase [Indibacter alkaliphilus]EOZ95624.1 Glycoprotein gp2 [Indibacter alkaliphilus LW1]